jgi:hypothetical protein
MSEAKWTPGPWRIQRTGSHNPLIDTDAVTVAEVLDDPDHPEQEANARLNAAAPCLLTALMSLYDATTSHDPDAIRSARSLALKAMGNAWSV